MMGSGDYGEDFKDFEETSEADIEVEEALMVFRQLELQASGCWIILYVNYSSTKLYQKENTKA